MPDSISHQIDLVIIVGKFRISFLSYIPHILYYSSFRTLFFTVINILGVNFMKLKWFIVHYVLGIEKELFMEHQ